MGVRVAHGAHSGAPFCGSVAGTLVRVFVAGVVPCLLCRGGGFEARISVSLLRPRFREDLLVFDFSFGRGRVYPRQSGLQTPGRLRLVNT